MENQTENQTQKELEWKEPTKIPDEKHFGTIVKVGYRDDPYEYTDVFVKLDDADITMKYGCPTLISPNSKLGRLLIAFGVDYEKGKKLKPTEILQDKRVEFMTITRPSRKDPTKSFSEIVEDSIKPIQQQPQQPTQQQPPTVQETKQF